MLARCGARCRFRIRRPKRGLIKASRNFVTHLGPLVASLIASLAFAFNSSAAEPDIRRDATVAAVERVMPCVVNIATESVVEYEDFYQRLFSDFFGPGRYAPRLERESS